LLALHRIDEARINGAQQMEFTHAAVAAYVASGMADVSFGVEGRRPAVRARFRPASDRGLFLRLPPCVSGDRADAARARRHERQRISQGGGSASGYVTANSGSVSTVQEFLSSVDAKTPAGGKRKK
jgi:hypothetical protein